MRASLGRLARFIRKHEACACACFMFSNRARLLALGNCMHPSLKISDALGYGTLLPYTKVFRRPWERLFFFSHLPAGSCRGFRAPIRRCKHSICRTRWSPATQSTMLIWPPPGQFLESSRRSGACGGAGRMATTRCAGAAANYMGRTR